VKDKEYRRLRNQLSIESKKSQKLFFENKFAENCESAGIWSTANLLTGKRKQKSTAINHLLKEGIETDSKAEFGDLLFTAFVPNKNLTAPEEKVSTVLKFMESAEFHGSPFILAITDDEVLSAIKEVKSDASVV